jgi:hypothetical protein
VTTTRWAAVIVLFYAVLLAGLLLPGMMVLAGSAPGKAYGALAGLMSGAWPLYVWVLALVAGQALMLLLSVEGGWRRLRPRTRVRTTVALVALLAGLLLFAGYVAVMAAVHADAEGPWIPVTPRAFLGWWLGAWLFWALLFLGFENSLPTAVDRFVRWLLAGSVLELLVAVTAHVIVRQRGDCSAPIATGFGIVTGGAVALLCFGPGLLALVRRRMARYAARKGGAG